jgi:hypothetical protein
MSMLQEILLWSSAIVAIICTSMRALNIGYQRNTYLASAACYLVFAMFSSDFKQQILNGFYFCVAVGGAFRWK